ncbi:MAG: class I SAM-dependent methyltransferase [Candidatus Heimdallarchaeota archaeon]|nr:MAG: class I SAM-dependent methyltransferase [Candidatus Heimdallarchaeota archaeon]
MLRETQLKSRNYQRILKQLKLCDISGGVWIDAGCGRGSYTFPLASLADKVVAIDNNPYNISFLKSSLPSNSNIEVFKKDFTYEVWHEPVDGMLFGFSLHYDPTPQKALQKAFTQLKPDGTIVILDYVRTDPVPWVPFPLPIFKLRSLLEEVGFYQIETIHQNNRFYIVQGRK